jgi:hypothetical protein
MSTGESRDIHADMNPDRGPRFHLRRRRGSRELDPTVQVTPLWLLSCAPLKCCNKMPLSAPPCNALLR